MRHVLTIVLGLALTCIAWGQRSFVHPGLSHKKSDLDRMKYMVKAGIEPYLTSYNDLKDEAKASSSYTVQGNSSMTTVTQGGLNYGAFYSDVKAAYLNALMWAITEDEAHAEKCVEIFNAWSNLTCFTGGGTQSLNAGRVIWQLVEAAEIIKSTYSGWDEDDISAFGDMLVYPGYSSTEEPSSVSTTNGTFYWRMFMGDASRHGNQDLFGWRGVMAIAVFLDNELMYNRALRYLKGLSHDEDDLPYQSGPPINSSSPTTTNQYYDGYSISGFESTTADYGYNGVIGNYIWENGQSQEASRDQAHAILGVGMCASVAEIAWNQGDDLYGWLDNRILLGYEYALKYNVSYTYAYADQTSPWEPTASSGEFIQRSDRTGRWYSKAINPTLESNFEDTSRGSFKTGSRPIYELALAHYGVRQGFDADDMKWTQRALDISIDEDGYEKNGWSLDHLGWGALTCRRPEGCAGDPCTMVDGNPEFAMHVLPGTIEAEDFDYFTGDGEGHTYSDESSSNEGGEYRTSEAVDIETCSAGGYNITNIESGEWLSYTVYVPQTTTYTIRINYAAAQTSGKIRIWMGGEYVTSKTTLPYGDEYSTGTNDWRDYTLKENVTLNAGVQWLKVYFSGQSEAFKLNNIQVVSESEAFGLIDDDFESDTDGWEAATTGASVTQSDGRLVVTTADASSTQKRGDIKRTNAANLHAGLYPIVAFKISKPETCNILFDTNLGSYKNGANKWTGQIGDVIYYDLTQGGFGSSSHYLSTTDVTALTLFQLKVADITSGEESYTVDWVKTFESLEALQEEMGLISDTFESSVDGWEAATSGASLALSDGELVVYTADASSTKKRGDIKRTNAADLHAGLYPIVAFKISKPGTCNILFDTNLGSYKNGANKWTGQTGDVIYYDLTQGGFGSSSHYLSTTDVTALTLFQLKVADITSGEESYTVDWVKTFESVDDLEDELKSTSSAASKVPGAIEESNGTNCFCADNALHFTGLSGQGQISIYNLQGKLLRSQTINGTEATLTWDKQGVFLVNIQSGEASVTKKILCHE